MKTPSSWLSALARLAIGGGMLAYLALHVDLSGLAGVLRESLNRWPWLAGAAVLCFLCLAVGVARWKLILDGRGLRMTWSRVFCVFFIGQFFNAFLFGATGGDLARGYYAARETHHKKAEAVATVLIDRLVGLVLLDAMALAMMIARAGFFLRHWVTHVPALLMLAMNAATAVGILLLFNTRWFAHWPGIRRVARHPVFGRLLRRLLVSVLLYRRHPGVLVKTCLLTVVAHLLLVLQCQCIGLAMGISLGFVGYLTVVPMIMAIAALPITPGGLGVREGMAVALFGALGVASTRALPLSLMTYVISLVWSLLGGVIFLGYTAGAGTIPSRALRELREEPTGALGQGGIARPHE